MSPAYLAGPRDDADDIYTEPLLDHGWTFSDDGADIALATSPCLRVRFGWLPEVRGELPIQIAAGVHPLASPLWHIAVDSETPTEILNALFSRLAWSLSGKPQLLFGSAARRQPVLPLPDSWVRYRDSQVSVGSSPDTLAHITTNHQVASTSHELRPRWEFCAGPPERRWTARFSEGTPSLLVEAFHEAFTNPSPVTRTRYELDPLLEPHLTITNPAAHRASSASAGGSPVPYQRTSPPGPRMTVSAPPRRH